MKFTIAILVVLLFASNAFWVYHDIDQSVTHAYQNLERYEGANRQIATAVIATDAVREKSKEEVEALLKRLFPNELVFEKEGALHTSWLTLPLTPQGRVSGIAADPLAVAQSELKVRGAVGNEVFWPKK